MLRPIRTRINLGTYCIFGCGKINAWRARGARAQVSVNFRKFSPCMARARRTRAGLTVYPPSRTFLALSAKRKQKYQNGNIHRKLKVPTSVILPRPRIQYEYTTAVYSCSVLVQLHRDTHHECRRTLLLLHAVPTNIAYYLVIWRLTVMRL